MIEDLKFEISRKVKNQNVVFKPRSTQRTEVLNEEGKGESRFYDTVSSCAAGDGPSLFMKRIGDMSPICTLGT